MPQPKQSTTDPLLAAFQRKGLMPPEPPTPEELAAQQRQNVMDWVKAENAARAAKKPAADAQASTVAQDALDILGPQEQTAVPGLNDERIVGIAQESQGGNVRVSVANLLRAAWEQKAPADKPQYPGTK